MKYVISNCFPFIRNCYINYTIIGTVSAKSRLEAIDIFVKEHNIEWYRPGLRAAWIECEAAKELLSRLVTQDVYDCLISEGTSNIFMEIHRD